MLVASSAPLDQYCAADPQSVVGAPVEHARIDPDNTEIVGRAGYDFVIIDMEHSPLGIIEATEHIRAADATGIAPNDLMDTPPIIFDAMCEILNRRTQ